MSGDGEQVAELGAPVEEYRAGWWSITFIALGALCLITGLFFATILLVGALTDARQTDPQVGFLIAAAFIAAAIYVARGPWQNRGLRVVVHQRGLSLTRAGRTRAIRWDDVDFVIQTAGVASLEPAAAKIGDKILLVLRSKEQIQFNYMTQRIGSLITRIQSGVGESQALEALRAWSAGQIVSFGPLALVHTGISDGVETIPWSEMGPVTYALGHVQIRRASTGKVALAAPLASVRNLGVLLEVVSRIREI